MRSGFKLEIHLRGEDVILHVKNLSIRRGVRNPNYYDSDADFYGDIDVEYDILNKDGTKFDIQRYQLSWDERFYVDDCIVSFAEELDYDFY